MPLQRSGSKDAFKANVSALMGDVGKSPHVKTRDQALAIAYDIKRKNRASGGAVHAGPINSIVPGRTDHHPMKVAPGSYVINADTVSHVGHSNTQAGQAILSHMFGPNGPLGFGRSPAIKRGPGAPRPPAMVKRAAGGASEGEDDADPVDINAAGGEYVLTPEQVAHVGGGDIKRGHALLDEWMQNVRKDYIRTLKKLPGPAKS